MAGVASVKVAPEARGRGIGRQLMTELLARIAARGYPLSALYPATMPIYRSLGWELAGSRYHAVIPARSLRDLLPADKAIKALTPNETGAPGLRKVTPGDAASVISALGHAHEAARDCGPATRDLAWMTDRISHGGEYAYVGGDAFLSYEWQPGSHDLFVGWAVAASVASQRELWSVLAGYSSIVHSVTVRTSPDNPIWWLLRERDAQLVKRSMWMLRVVDVKAAIEGRGFGTAVVGSVRLNLADDARPQNAGTWELAVSGGTATLERAEADAGALTLGARGLAALYGGTPMATLRLAGLATGGTAEDDEFLSAAFGCTSFMLDVF